MDYEKNRPHTTHSTCPDCAKMGGSIDDNLYCFFWLSRPDGSTGLKVILVPNEKDQVFAEYTGNIIHTRGVAEVYTKPEPNFLSHPYADHTTVTWHIKVFVHYPSSGRIRKFRLCEQPNPLLSSIKVIGGVDVLNVVVETMVSRRSRR